MPDQEFVQAVAPEGDDVPSVTIRTQIDRTRNEGGLASMCRQYCPPHRSSSSQLQPSVPYTRAPRKDVINSLNLSM